MVRRIFRYLFFGIAWGCTCFVFTGVAGVLASGEAFLEPVARDFVAQAIGRGGCGHLLREHGDCVYF